MIIACPSCGARYKVKDELIKEKGKKVKCKKCSSIFKAFRDKDSVLLKAAPGKEDDFKTRQVDPAAATAGIKVSVGRQAPAAPSPPTPAAPRAEEVAGQATVRVDRSKLQDYLKQSGNEAADPPPPPPSLDAFKQDPEDDFPLGNLDQHSSPPETDETVRVNPNDLAAQVGDAGATMAVDRSQIDQFLKQQVEEDDPLGDLAGDDPLGAESGVDSGATMAMDRSQLDAMMANRNDEDEDLLGLGQNDGGEAPDTGATMAVDRSQIDAFLNQNQAPTDTADPFATQEATADPFTTQEATADPFATQEPPEEPAPQDAGATMAVDRSQIDAFLNQNQAPAEPSEPAAPEAPPEPSDDLGLDDDAGDVGATMAVDRSQIDAFLEQNQTPAMPQIPADDDSLTFDETPDTGPLDEAGATVAVDRSQLDAFLAQAGEEDPVTDEDFAGLGDKPDLPVDQDPIAAEFAGLDPAAETPPADDPFADDFATGPNQDAAPEPPDFSDFGTEPNLEGGDATATMMDNDVISDTPVSEPDPMDVASNHDQDDPFASDFAAPSFPSDDELGIAEEAAQLDPPPAADPFATVVSDEPPNFSDVDPSDFGEESAPPSDTIPHLDAEQNAQIQAEGALWQAKIDDETYPDLTLDVVERWIIEDRLLETDQLAPGGTQDFRRADEVPEVAPFFAKYNKSGSGGQGAAQPKKGFFGWLKSLFKK